jgi:hypothetical protein
MYAPFENNEPKRLKTFAKQKKTRTFAYEKYTKAEGTLAEWSRVALRQTEPDSPRLNWRSAADIREFPEKQRNLNCVVVNQTQFDCTGLDLVKVCAALRIDLVAS